MFLTYYLNFISLESYINELIHYTNMGTVTLEQVNENILALKEEIDEIKSYIEEDNMELSDDIKIKIEESRKTPISKMKTQEEIEKKFL